MFRLIVLITVLIGCSRDPNEPPIDSAFGERPIAPADAWDAEHIVQGYGTAPNPAMARARAIADAKAEAGRIRAMDVAAYAGRCARTGDRSAEGAPGSDPEEVAVRLRNASSAPFSSAIHGPESMERTGDGQFACHLCLAIPMWQVNPSRYIDEAQRKADRISAMHLVAKRFEDAGMNAWAWECWQDIADCPLATPAVRTQAIEAQNRLQEHMSPQR